VVRRYRRLLLCTAVVSCPAQCCVRDLRRLDCCLTAFGATFRLAQATFQCYTMGTSCYLRTASWPTLRQTRLTECGCVELYLRMTRLGSSGPSMGGVSRRILRRVTR
jgi:hypothetical protein